MNPKKLYIIGNGFDLHHGINSSYLAFKSWLIESGRLEEDDELGPYFKCDDLWSSFEENLGLFDYGGFAQDIAADNLPDMSSEHADRTRSNARCAVEVQLKEWKEVITRSLPAWLNQLTPPDPNRRIYLDASDAFFITFNYTMTLEYFYGIPSENVFHIHGRIGDNADALMLGHGGLKISAKDPFDGYTVEDPPDPNDALAVEEAIEEAWSIASNWEKPVDEIIRKNSAFFDSLASVEEMYVYGFSFSEVDKKYIGEILAHVPVFAAKVVGWHALRDIINAKRCLGKDITFVKLDDIVSKNECSVFQGGKYE